MVTVIAALAVTVVRKALVVSEAAQVAVVKRSVCESNETVDVHEVRVCCYSQVVD